jgi:hypothetical protein
MNPKSIALPNFGHLDSVSRVFKQFPSAALERVRIDVLTVCFHRFAADPKLGCDLASSRSSSK